jgi:hypothetical protein
MASKQERLERRDQRAGHQTGGDAGAGQPALAHGGDGCGGHDRPQYKLQSGTDGRGQHAGHAGEPNHHRDRERQ